MNPVYVRKNTWFEGEIAKLVRRRQQNFNRFITILTLDDFKSKRQQDGRKEIMILRQLNFLFFQKIFLTEQKGIVGYL